VRVGIGVNEDPAWTIENDGYVVYGDSSSYAPDANGQVYFGGWAIFGPESELYASAQDFYSVWGTSSYVSSHLYNLVINYYVTSPTSQCGPQTYSRYYIDFCQPSGMDWMWRDAENLPHEMGHVIHYWAFDGSVQADYSYDGDSTH